MNLVCPDCAAPMVLRHTNKFTTQDGRAKKFYGCSRWPRCKATHGAHPDGRPLGIPASAEVKTLRMRAHIAAERIWGKWDSPECDKVGMYEWMKRNTKAGHIAGMDRDELLKLIAKLETIT